MSDKHKTPMIDELEKGPFPSFVTEIKKARNSSSMPDMADDELGQLEKSFQTKRGYWKHGGIVGVLGYGSGVIGRYSSLPEEFPGVAHFHTYRINQPSGFFYTAKALKEICDIWDKYGSGLTNMHGSTGDLVLLGTTTENLEILFAEYSSRGWDLGGSGSAMRTPSCCVGQARCEWAMIDTMDICNTVTQHFQDELHRPAYPYKIKNKISGCACDCVAAIARADISVIGTWKGDIQIDQAEVKNYADSGMDIKADVIDWCPTSCMSFDGSSITIDNSQCKRCMHCITRMTKALKPGKERGASILVGSKAPIVVGSLLSWVVVPFMKMESPYTEFKELWEKAIDWWDENGNTRERIAELIDRVGMRVFLKAMDIEPIPQMVMTPRSNPYYFWD